MLVAAMVIMGLVCVIGSAAAAAAEAGPPGTEPGTAAMIVFGLVMTIVVALGLFVAMSAKNGHTVTRPGRLAKALNTSIVHRVTAVNSRYAFTNVARATSPRNILHLYAP